MTGEVNSYKIFIESGKKKVFAGALDWPGWCRFGRDEPAAIQALIDAAPRYEKIVRAAGLALPIPEDDSELAVIERVEGNATTDFGAPDASLSVDEETIEAAEMRRFQAVLNACWEAFDHAVRDAQGRELRKGPRGGGRDLEAIIEHVLSADEAYLKRIGWKIEAADAVGQKARLESIRKEIMDGFEAAARGELPTQGPRGGKRWPARFFVRRTAWHIVDHAWEIEDRVI
jgi:hypothetical protein